MPPAQALTLALGGFAAGTVNAIAGGGTLLSFPLLLTLGRDPLLANATNTVALFPGSLAGVFGFRSHVTPGPRLAVYVGLPCLGSLAGAGLLLLTPSRIFAWLVPYLIVSATVLFALADRLTRAGVTGRRRQAAWLILPAAGLYGGYFGAGMGIIMLATLGLLGVADLHERNAIKNLIAASVGGVTSAVFVASGIVLWSDALPMGLGALAGGYAGAHLARRLGRGFVRVAVIVIGVTLTAWYFTRN